MTQFKLLSHFKIAGVAVPCKWELDIIAKNRPTCSCEDGCIGPDCNCKQETLKNYLQNTRVSKARAFQEGFPQEGVYKNDRLDVPENILQNRLLIFECCKDCSCMKDADKNKIECRNTLMFGGLRNPLYMIAASIASFKVIEWLKLIAKTSYV